MFKTQLEFVFPHGLTEMVWRLRGVGITFPTAIINKTAD